MPEIPSEVSRIESEMEMILKDFDILETFFVLLSDDVLHLKLSTRKQPQKIAKRVEEITLKHQFDFEQFRKLQTTDEVKLYEKTDALAAEVEVYSSKHDFDDLSRIAIYIDKLWGGLKETMMRAEMLNNRQKIFNQPEIDTERLAISIERLHPHHTLWTMAANFLQSKDDWTFSPLSSVDVDAVGAEMKRCKDILQDSRLHFVSNAEMLLLIEKIAAVVDVSDKALDVMKDLMNPDFREEHWTLLEEKTGIAIKYTRDLTFDSLAVRGIMKNADVVKEILVQATREREARQLEQIEEERKLQEQEELAKQKKARRVARVDI